MMDWLSQIIRLFVQPLSAIRIGQHDRSMSCATFRASVLRLRLAICRLKRQALDSHIACSSCFMANKYWRIMLGPGAGPLQHASWCKSRALPSQPWRSTPSHVKVVNPWLGSVDCKCAWSTLVVRLEVITFWSKPIPLRPGSGIGNRLSTRGWVDA